MNSIKSLQQSVGNSLRSSVILFDLPRVVEELVYNSVDAGANKIYVSINMKACYVKVEDDGCGIIRDDLVILGERYATSRSHIADNINDKSFGFRGEALASLSDVSIVEIRTRVRGMPHAYCKILKGPKCLYFGIDDQKEAAGTVVIVRDLFYNQPVRRKCMHSSPKRVLYAIKKSILRIALVQSHIQFKITDIASEDELLCTEPSLSPLLLISDAFGHEVSSSLHEIVHSDKTLTLSGYISRPTNAFSTKAFQYIYINFRFLSKGPLHNLLNDLATSWQCSSSQPEFQPGKRHKTQEYPAFLLNLRCPMSSYDLHFEPSKTVVEFKEWSTILSFFQQSIKHFWNQVSEIPLDRRNLSAANKRKLDDAFPIESTAYKRVLIKSTKMKKVECEPHPSEHAHTGFHLKKIKPSDTMHSFSWLKPCSRKFEVNDEASCSSHHKICDSFANFSGSDYTNNNECDMPVYMGSDYFGHFEIDDVKNQFTLPCLSTPSPVKKDWSPLLRYDRRHSATFEYPGGLDLNLDHTPLSVVSLVGRTCFQEDDLTYTPPVSTSRNAYTSHDLDLSPKNSFSSDDVSFYMHNDFLASSKANCYIGFPQSSPVKPRREGIQSSNSVQNSSNVLFPSSSKRTELNFHDGFKLERNLQYESPSVEQNTLEKVSTIAFSDETGLSPLVSPFVQFYMPFYMPNADLYDKHECQTSTQIRDKLGCSWNKLDVENCPTSKIQMMGSKRSSSAPPFYKAKHKFSTLTLTDPNAFTSKQETILQQCLKTYGNDKAQSFARGGTDANCIKHNLGEFGGTLNNYSKKDESALSTSLSPPYFKTTADELPREFFDVKISTHQIDDFQKIGEFDEACHSKLSLNNSADGIAGKDKEWSTATKWRTGNHQHTVSDKSHINEDNVLSISSGLLHLSSSSLIPEFISKECLENARVLLQLDHKFIPVIAGDILVVIDQHAADERIRLEELRRKVLSGEGTSVSYLESEQQLVLPEMGYQLLQKYAEQVKKWGWICNVQNAGSESFSKNVNLLRRRKCSISLVAVPCILGSHLSGGDLIEYIEQLVETDGSSIIPPSVNRILNSKACRGAIMFGDTLLHSECCLIVEELKATSLCFQCAHGRPTTVPIVNMSSLRKELANIQDIGGDGTYKVVWHGLKKHKPSIERAQVRLESAERFEAR